MANKKRSTGDAIREALAGLKSSITRAELIQRTGVSSVKIGGTLNHMVKTGIVIPHAGPTKRTTGYTLNPDHAPDLVRPKNKSRTSTSRSTRHAGQSDSMPSTNGDGLLHRHLATTLQILTDVIGLNGNDPQPEQLLERALKAHAEAIEMLAGAA